MIEARRQSGPGGPIGGGFRLVTNPWEEHALTAHSPADAAADRSRGGSQCGEPAEKSAVGRGQ